jgi:putative flippase GtrA
MENMGIIKTIVFGDKSLTEKQEKNRKLFMYLVSGGLTTAVNWGCFVLFDLIVKADMTVTLFGFSFSLKTAINQTVCWILAVLVAYFLNRITVFRSKGKVFRELVAFFGARIVSFLVLELGFMYLMIWICQSITKVPVSSAMTYFGSFAFTYEYLLKLINSVFIVITNYLMSKMMVFKKKDLIDYKAEDKTSSGKAEADV